MEIFNAPNINEVTFHCTQQKSCVHFSIYKTRRLKLLIVKPESLGEVSAPSDSTLAFSNLILQINKIIQGIKHII